VPRSPASGLQAPFLDWFSRLCCFASLWLSSTVSAPRPLPTLHGDHGTACCACPDFSGHNRLPVGWTLSYDALISPLFVGAVRCVWVRQGLGVLFFLPRLASCMRDELFFSSGFWLICFLRRRQFADRVFRFDFPSLSVNFHFPPLLTLRAAANFFHSFFFCSFHALADASAPLKLFCFDLREESDDDFQLGTFSCAWFLREATSIILAFCSFPASVRVTGRLRFSFTTEFPLSRRFLNPSGRFISSFVFFERYLLPAVRGASVEFFIDSLLELRVNLCL